MRRTLTILTIAGMTSVISPSQAGAQSNIRRNENSRPLVLRVTPRGFYRPMPVYLVGSNYVPMSAFDPIALAPPLGPSANNIAIVLPVSSASCQVTPMNGRLFASPGCLGQ
jgi:hypothetical protein